MVNRLSIEDLRHLLRNRGLWSDVWRPALLYGTSPWPLSYPGGPVVPGQYSSIGLRTYDCKHAMAQSPLGTVVYTALEPIREGYEVIGQSYVHYVAPGSLEDVFPLRRLRYGV